MKIFSVSTILASFAFEVAKADVCMMLYQLADNDLEYFIRQDNNELISSTAIKDPTLTTWVYFDGRNYGTTEDITAPLDDIVNPDGTPVTEKAEGSLYLNWDHSLEKMVVNASSTSELNGDDPQTLLDFLQYAMTDCVARGSTEYMLIMSSHGSGMFGFGGDENTARRRLVQSNQNIVSAVQFALESVEGAPDKLDVLGFDACLMSAVDALDEYRNITKYYLASEAVEPGHGWAYSYLTPETSALNYAKNFHDNFLQQTQVVDYHLTPKTMAIVESDNFTTFLSAWDALFTEMNTQISSDKNVHTITQRARLNTLAFNSAIDTSNTKSPSAMDIGSFFATFRTLCSIDPNSDLETLMQGAEATYADMFVTRGVGPGTPPATGMHILWPERRVYQELGLEDILWDGTLTAATGSAPNWLTFLQTFYKAPAPETVSENSVCLQSVVSDLETDAEGLLLTPEVVAGANAVTASSAVTVGTDSISVSYGLDLTSLMNGRLRHLKETIPAMAINNQNRKLLNHPLHPRGESAGRRLQSETGDYFILFGGDVLGSFEGPDFVASWDKNFYLLGNADSAEQIYATDAGDGLKSIPVMYLSSSNPITASDLPLGTSIAEVEALGGVFGFLIVSLADAVDSVISSSVLYTFDKTGALSETPASAGGQITPVLFSELVVGDIVVTELVGGFGSTIFPFDSETELGVVVLNATSWLDAFEDLDSVVIDMAAYDNDIEDGFDFYSTSVPYDDLKGGSSGGEPSEPSTPVAPSAATPTDKPPSAQPPTAGGNGSSSGSSTIFWTASVMIPALMIMVV